MNTRRVSNRGFSIIEFVLVIAITGIIAVGLASVVEVPRAVLEQKTKDGPDLASTQTALSLLQNDVQFATGAHCPSINQLVLDKSDGSSVTWEWDGVTTHPLTRTEGAQTIAVIDSVKSIAFSVKSTSYPNPVGDDGVLVKTPVQTAAFDTFVLKPGYTLLKVVVGKTKVNLLSSVKSISNTDRAGIYFVPTSLDDDNALLATISVRLQRTGAQDLEVQVYEADASRNPDRSKPVAHAVLPNRAIPVSMGDVVIPMSAQKKLDKTKTYFAELRSAGSGLAAALEATYLSDGAAAESSGTNLFTSTDSGLSFAAITSAIDGSQTKFSMTAVKALTVADADVPTGIISLPTSVSLKLVLSTTSGSDSVLVSYPMLNAVAQVTQAK